MASSTVGLDIGTHAVRAVELSFGRGEPTLRRFGQVALPYGAVVNGEVVDGAAVTQALRRLWREGGFKARSVVTGVANARVVARTAEVPAMPDDELRSSLRFQVQDLIPIPVDEAVLDYQVLERTVGPEQQEQLRILLVAAHQDMIGGLLGALAGAGLTAARIDLAPFALIRSLYVDGLAAYGESPEQGGAAPTAEAIVDVGGGVTNIVVHDGGVPRFVRTLPSGGNAVASAIGDELGVDVDTAEELKRRADPLSADTDEARAGQIVATQLTPLLDDIRGSLDFYLAQAEEGSLRRILLTGGGARMPDLAARLSALLGVPVEPAHPLESVRLGRTGIPEEVLQGAEDVLAVPIGLALSGEAAAGEVRRVNLLPAEVGIRQAARRQTVLAGLGIGALVLLLMVVWFLRQSQVGDARDEAKAEEARSAELQQEVNALQPVADLEQEIATRRTRAETVLANDVAWTRLLQEVATVMPNDVWLTAFSGTSSPDDGTGAITVSAMGFEQPSTARWLLRLDDLGSITGLWVPTSSRTGGSDGEAVQFSSNAELTPAARSDRAADFAEEGE